MFKPLYTKENLDRMARGESYVVILPLEVFSMDCLPGLQQEMQDMANKPEVMTTEDEKKGKEPEAPAEGKSGVCSMAKPKQPEFGVEATEVHAALYDQIHNDAIAILQAIIRSTPDLDLSADHVRGRVTTVSVDLAAKLYLSTAKIMREIMLSQASQTDAK